MLFIFVLPALILLALLTYARPPAATILLVALTPAYLIKFSIATLPTNFFEISVLVIFSFSLARQTIRQQWWKALRQMPPWTILFITLFVLSAIISTFISPHPRTSLGILKGWIFIPLLAGWLVYAFSLADKTNNLYLLTTPKKEIKRRCPIRSCKRIIRPESSEAAAGAAENECQDLYRVMRCLITVNSYNNFYAHALRSLVLSGLVVSLVGLTQINQQNRVRSIYDVSNSLALFIAPLLVIAFYLTITGYKKTLYLPATIILSIALLATQSTSGIAAAAISMLVGVIIYYYSSKRLHKTKLARSLSKSLIPGIALITLFTIASLFIITTTGRLSYLMRPWQVQDSHNSISVRLQLWSIGFDLIKERPLLGIGLGTFEPAYQRILHARFSQFNNCKLLSENCAKPLAEFVYRDPHNWPLSFWLNTGLIGLSGFALINIIVIWQAVARLRSIPRNPNHIFITATILALISLLLFGLADTIYWKNDLAALHWVLIGLLMAKNAKSESEIN